MSEIIRAVIFDMDGVLVNSEPLTNAAAIAMFKEKGLTVQPTDFLPFTGMGEERYIGGVAETYHFPLNAKAAKQRAYEIYLERAPHELQVFPGTYDLVIACRKAGLRVAVASSSDDIKVNANLRTVGVPLRLWDTVVTGEQITHKKPAPDIFLTAARNMNIKPSACVVVEDAANGIQAAKAAGMRSVALTTTLSAERLKEADVIREDISHVKLSDLAPQLADR